MGEGGVARLTCQVHGIPEANITWQRDRRSLTTDDPRYCSTYMSLPYCRDPLVPCSSETTLRVFSVWSRYTLLPNGVLQITSVRRTDSGLFRCVASNIANTRFSLEAQLSVTGKTRLGHPHRASGSASRPFRCFMVSGFSCRIQDIPGARHPVRSSEPHYQRSPDRHPGVHRHRKPPSHRVLESPW